MFGRFFYIVVCVSFLSFDVFYLVVIPFVSYLVVCIADAFVSQTIL